MGTAFAAPPALADESPETVVVTASALPGTSLDADKLPLSTDTITSSDLTRYGTASILGALERGGGGVSLSEAQDNPFQPNIYYHGFQASPLAGDAQGLAVYVDGVRFNQPFGDVVGWDLIPDIAVDKLTVEGSNPIFGLNALGGSIALTMKNGFLWQGSALDGAGGSFGRWQSEFQFGREDGDMSVYVAGNALHETGWRDHSPSRLGQVFADLGWRDGRAELHLDLIGADTDLTGNGTAPVELLAVDRAAIFTFPDNTRNTYGLANLFGSFQAGEALSPKPMSMRAVCARARSTATPATPWSAATARVSSVSTTTISPAPAAIRSRISWVAAPMPSSTGPRPAPPASAARSRRCFRPAETSCSPASPMTPDAAISPPIPRSAP